jgi:S1-C subfamily serine protease
MRQVLQMRGDTAVPVKFVMSVSGAGNEQQQEGQTQGTIVSADGLILVPGRVVSIDLGAFARPGAKGMGGMTPTMKSGQFRVRLAGSDEWVPADLVTRDTELGLAWLRVRNPHGMLPFVDFTGADKIGVGTELFTVMRTSDQFGSVPTVRVGYVLGETTVPRPMLLVDGAPGVAFDADGKPAGFVDVDLAGMARSRANSGGIGMDLGDMVFSMIPADRVGRVTARAAVLPVVKPADGDEGDSPPKAVVPAPKHAERRLSASSAKDTPAPDAESPSKNK